MKERDAKPGPQIPKLKIELKAAFCITDVLYFVPISQLPSEVPLSIVSRMRRLQGIYPDYVFWTFKPAYTPLGQDYGPPEVPEVLRFCDELSVMLSFYCVLRLPALSASLTNQAPKIRPCTSTPVMIQERGRFGVLMCL